MGAMKIVALEPRRLWWARPRKLVALERPGGGGRSHRPERREAELAWLSANGVRLIVSTMATRHNLADYERHGFEWHHMPVPDVEADGAAALEELLPLLKRELRVPGAVAVHGNRRTDFVAALCAAHMYDAKGMEPEEALLKAAEAGLDRHPGGRRAAGRGLRAGPAALGHRSLDLRGTVGHHVGVHDRAVGVDRDREPRRGAAHLGDRGPPAGRSPCAASPCRWPPGARPRSRRASRAACGSPSWTSACGASYAP